MKLSELGVFISILNKKAALGKDWSSYSMRYNSHIRRVLIKLQEMSIINNLNFSGNLVKFEPINCASIKSYLPIPVNRLNMPKIKKQYLKSNPYYSLLVTTSAGLYTLEECVELKKGGLAIALIQKKRV